MLQTKRSVDNCHSKRTGSPISIGGDNTLVADRCDRMGYLGAGYKIENLSFILLPDYGFLGVDVRPFRPSLEGLYDRPSLRRTGVYSVHNSASVFGI